jgi:lipopolysaccharide/colanic/teichoic acid biosynthesis glycosyltransferase
MALKRAMDVAASGVGLLLAAPFLLIACLSIWLEDRHSPFYVASRVGRSGRPFRMVKLRSMTVRADRTGVDSTAQDDPRITRVGRVLRRFKLDECSQLWNVLRGDMSMVGPRPQVARDVRLYTAVERHLLDAPPGITDFASIVFADEGAILEGSDDPDLRYNQIIRPWKSRLGLHYIAHCSLWLDIRLMAATLLAALSRRRALVWVADMLTATGADPVLTAVARRDAPLAAAAPPGATEVVQSREPAVEVGQWGAAPEL